VDNDSIVNLFLNKDEAAIIHTAEKYGSRLRSISQRITADCSVAEECENDTYLEAWNRIPSNNQLIETTAIEFSDIYFNPLSS